jgi:diguanylate cyclase (GGDEF)-like protein
MTTVSIEETDIGSALAMLWQRHQPSILERIALLELTAANVLRGTVSDNGIVEGCSAAHKLAGSLGTFGFDAGSRAALEAELLLRESTVDGRLLAEAVMALRASVNDGGPEADPPPAPVAAVQPATHVAQAAHIVSLDPELTSRLTVEASAIGLTVSSTSEVPWIGSMGTQVPCAIVIDDAGRSWARSDMLNSVSELAQASLVVVLTENETFQDRMALARAGATGVIQRSQGARQIVAFLAEALAQQEPSQFAVLALNLDPALSDALSGLECRVDDCVDPPMFWELLERQGADVVIIGFDGAHSNGPDLCRVIRADPRWRRLPVVVIGDRARGHFDAAMAAGADDYLSAKAATRELQIRLQRHGERGRISQTRSDLDPLTGTENRAAAERSIDRLFRMAARRNDPFAFGLVTVDHLDKICAAGGTALGDVVLRRLAGSLVERFRDEDMVGRWTHDGFAIGIYGGNGDQARDRIADVLQRFSTEGFPTTTGKLAYYTFSAGVAAAPADGSTLGSLQRLAETALRRARSVQNSVVASGRRPAEPTSAVVDVVLVEDDDSVADVVEHALSLRQYTFLRFTDGAEAAKALGEERVKCRIVLLDVGLPSLDGFGVLQDLRNRGLLEKTRVIMLTARSSEAETLRALDLGATEHITKPFSIPVLLGRLAQTLSDPVT